MRKEHETQENIDNQIPTEMIDVEAIKKKLTKQKIIIQVVFLLIFLSFGLIYVMNKNSSLSNQSYIGGNVMYVSTSAGEPTEEISVANPWRNASFLGSLLFRTLLETDSTYTQINQGIASDVTVSDDGLTYTVTMRDKQYWSDGEQITVDDVVFSFHAFMKCETVNSYLSSAFNEIKGATDYAVGKTSTISGISTDGNKVIIELQSPYSSFSLMLTQFVPLPEHILAGNDEANLAEKHEFFINNNGVYSGQFIVQGMDEDYNTILVKNSYYTDPITDIDMVKCVWDYENTELDYYATGDLTDMVSYRSMKGYQEHEVDVNFYRYFIFNLYGGDSGEENTIMQDERVRKAIYHAIDVDSLVNEVYFGKATPYYAGATLNSEKDIEYNPQKAKELLIEAGYDFNRPFRITYYSGDTYSRILIDRIASQLEEIGLTVETFKASVAEIYGDAQHDMVLKNLSALNTHDWYNEYLSTNATLSKILGTEGLFDDLVFKLNTTSNQQEYNNILLELVELEQELLYKMPMFLLTEAIYTNSNRLSVPDDIVFGNTRYRCDIRLDEWYIKKD